MKKEKVKLVAFTSLFWVVAAALVVGFLAYGNAKYNSGVNAGFDKAQELLQNK